MNIFNKISEKYKKYIKTIFWTFVLAFLFYLILPDKETIVEALNVIKGVSIPLLIIGSIVYFLTIPIYALQIFVLSIIKLNFWITYKVQMSVLLINKFIPAGISSFVMNSFYLVRKGSKPSEVASVIAMQGITSSIPFIILLITALLIGFSQYGLDNALTIDLGEIHWLRILVFIALIILIVAYIINRSSKLKNIYDKTLGSFWTQLKTFKDKPKELFWAFVTGLVSPIFGVTVLYISGHSVGVDVTFIQAFLVYALGTTIANIIPIPGGVGAAIAGLYAGFMFFGYSAAEALAASLIYRIITFWIPTIPGVIFFVNLKKDLLHGFSISDEFQKAKKMKKA